MVSLGLIGFPLGHSYSAEYFAGKFEHEGIEGSYELFPIESIRELPALLDSHPDLLGLNVTIPYKESVLPYLDSVSEDTREIGAINVIKISADCVGSRSLKGFNTDCIGFRDSLLPLLRPDIDSALVLGTGGASKAVAFALRKLNIRVTFVSRDAVRGIGRKDMITYQQLTEDIIRSNLLIVNCTPVGMYPHSEDAPDIPYQYIGPKHIAYDLIYNPAETSFMRLAAQMGATVINGLRMLHIQAEEAWKIWTDE